MNTNQQNKLMLMLENNPRVSITKIAAELEKPVSTIFDWIKKINEDYILMGIFFERPEYKISKQKVKLINTPILGMTSYNLKAILRLLDKANNEQIYAVIGYCTHKLKGDKK